MAAVAEESTEPEKVPRARLNQIATRKMNALGLVTRPRPSEKPVEEATLEGELVFKAAPMHPLKNVPVPKSAFYLVGHDRLQLLEPPLAALGPIPYYDCDQLSGFEQRVAVALVTRMGLLNKLADRMRALQMEVAFEPDRLLVRGMVRSRGYLFEILGAPEQVRVWRVTPAGQKAWDVPRAVPPLNLEAYQGAVDLEIHLTSSVGRWEQSKAEDVAPPVPAAPAPHAPENGLTVGLLRRFGDGANIQFTPRFEVSQELDANGIRYRFVAVHDKGNLFQAKLVGPSGEKWSERIDLTRFPGIASLLATQLKLTATQQLAQNQAMPAPAQAPSTGSSPTLTGVVPPQLTTPPSAANLPDYLLPHPGEIWVMHVIIEQERDGEVRYVCTDPEGRPYGAPRILKRVDFEGVFATEKGGWRLGIIIDQVNGETVAYRQLDPKGEARGASKTLATSILVSTFVPQSADY